MRAQQLVKCYQVDEKLQQIPFIIFMEKKADKVGWGAWVLVFLFLPFQLQPNKSDTKRLH